MINIYLSSQIYIKAKDIPLEIRKIIKEAYTFKYYDFRNGQRIENTINLMQTKKHKDNFWICLPPNLPYLINLLDKYTKEYLIIDNRTKITLEQDIIFKGKLRDYQLDVLEKLKEHKFNCILSLETGRGKTFLSSYIGAYLKTTTLFVASKRNYIEAFVEELRTNIEDYENNYVVINSKWLENGAIIKPYMSCSVQVLHNPEILEALKHKVGLFIGDEIHSSMISPKYSEGIFGISPMYRIYLSATPKSKSEGFIQCACSTNIVSEDNVKYNYKIKYQPVVIDLGQKVESNYKATEAYHERKKLIFNQEGFIPSITNFINWIVGLDRSILLFCTDKKFQENMSDMLNACGIKSQCLNSNTSNAKLESYFKAFEQGDIKVFIGGASTVEALSLYKLSVFIDVDLSDTDNSVEQKQGRLKRLKEEFCSKSKIYIKFIYKNMTENKYKFTIKPTLTNKKLSQYTDLQPTLYTNGFVFEEIFEEIFCEEIE